MNTIAYFLIRFPGAAPLLWIINLIVYAILAVIAWYILQWVAREFSVPEKIIKLLGILLFILLIASLFIG